MATPNEPHNYEVVQKIGQGSFGVITKVKRISDGKILCRKEIQYVRMSLKEREQLHAEFSILSSLRHPNIVAYYHRDHLKSSQELHLYMEYCGGGDLSRVIKQLSRENQFAQEEYVWSIFAQLITALYRCHHGVDPPDVGKTLMGPIKEPQSFGLRRKDHLMILHRDLKPENVFLGEDSSVKLGDFGLSKLMSRNDFASTYVGTPYYMSPEICTAERYTLHSDIWSLGCIIYELCARRPPFDARTHFELIQKIKSGRYDPLPSVYSPELQEVVKTCLKTDPLQRPDTSSLLQLPVVRLMRKERQAVELGHELRAKMRQLELQRAAIESEQARLRVDLEERWRRNWEIVSKQALESALRREWEVKARLEIDRQVQRQTAELHQAFDIQLQARLQAEIESQRLTIESSRRSSEVQSPTDDPTSSVSTSVDVDHPYSTDVTSFSLDSPVSLAGLIPPKTKRAPFARARTQFDSPMDVQMGDPSPMSIASLSLSPRRAAVLGQVSEANIFTQGTHATTNRWEPPLLSTSASDTDLDDDLPDLPSPTRLPRSNSIISDVLKAQRRPTLQRQQTVPANCIRTQPPLFLQANPLKKESIPTCHIAESVLAIPPRSTVPSSPVQATSPLRRLPSKSARIGKATGGVEMLKVAQQNSGVGRTLVELQQARAGTVDLETQHEVAQWDPEKDDMPSPFLVRGRKATAGLMGYGLGR